MSSPLFCLWLVSALCLHISLAQKCDDGYQLFPAYNSSRYKLPPVELDWAKALSLCQSDGGGAHLAVINSDKEAEVVKELMTQLAGTDFLYAWVGVNDIASEGRWVTVEGDLVSASGYNKWFGGGPSGGKQANCGHVHPDALYHDEDCSVVRPAICEKPNARRREPTF